MSKSKGIIPVGFLLGLFLQITAMADGDMRQKTAEFLTRFGLGDSLDVPVKVSMGDCGVVCIADCGEFIMQYMIERPQASSDARLLIEPGIKISPSRNKVMVVTHGWVDKAQGDWPEDVASEINKKIDPNEWLCVFFDWRGGASVINPVDAARYARNIAAARLGNAIVILVPELEHVHLIGHSAGCWVVNGAAEIIARKTDATIHLTFLDAYIPPFWKESHLGEITNKKSGWAEHYYTKDITLGATQKNLTAAYNVDISEIDLIVKEHKFPYRWYYATITGEYRDCDREAGDEVLSEYQGLDYGFARSLEAGPENWQKSLTLSKGNKAVKLKTPRKKHAGWNFFKKK
jgi:pimeloyl-ACP methyl ester carboxylesterase